MDIAFEHVTGPESMARALRIRRTVFIEVRILLLEPEVRLRCCSTCIEDASKIRTGVGWMGSAVGTEDLTKNQVVAFTVRISNRARRLKDDV